ncbi:hypothetical protein HK096_001056 [Nowakowskiella sp. JEL0078]|nr:hypothetical protein HK096_001056 [Nowakowskiella sp. JEL0078]
MAIQRSHSFYKSLLKKSQSTSDNTRNSPVREDSSAYVFIYLYYNFRNLNPSPNFSRLIRGPVAVAEAKSSDENLEDEGGHKSDSYFRSPAVVYSLNKESDRHSSGKVQLREGVVAPVGPPSFKEKSAGQSRLAKALDEITKSKYRPIAAFRISTPSAKKVPEAKEPLWAKPAFELVPGSEHEKYGISVVDVNGIRSEIENNQEGCFGLTGNMKHETLTVQIT